MMAMHERFEHMFGWPSFPTNNDDDYSDLPDDEDKLNPVDNLIDTEKKLLAVADESTSIRKKLDAVEPVCTTITEPPTTISPRKSRRKKQRTTQTTTCVKELIINGQKHFSEEITTTDNKGLLLKQSKTYGSIPVVQEQTSNGQ